VKDAGTQFIESLKSCDGSIQHVEYLTDLIQLLADSTVAKTEGSVVHILDNGLPAPKIRNQLDRVARAETSELNGATVGVDEITLSGLVETELGDMRQVLRNPAIDDPVDGMLVEAAIAVLLNQERVCGLADHKL
jgi:hypothetical protein